MLIKKLLFLSYKLLLIVLAFICFSCPSKAQSTIRFERLSIEQGLSQSFVSSILKDNQGFMWFSTNDGLNKYDGYDFTTYRHDPKNPNSMSRGSIFTSYLDSKGNIWIGLENSGLNKYDPYNNKFTSYPFEEGVGQANNTVSNKLSNQNVISIYEDKQGYIWVGTQRGLNKFDPQKNSFISFHFPEGLSNNIEKDQIRAIYQDKTGSFWLGSSDGLIEFDPNNQKFTTYLNDTNNFINAICEDEKGSLWIGTGNGLQIYDLQNKKYLKPQETNLPEELFKNQIKKVIRDNLGIFWLGTYDHGLYQYNPKNKGLKNYRNSSTDPNSISSNNVISLYIDKANILWIGTTEGINRTYLEGQFFDLYRQDPTNPTSLSSNFVMSLYEDNNKVLWVGTLDTGLNRYDPQTHTFSTFHGNLDPNVKMVLSKYVRAILRDSQGTLWVGSSSGLVSYDSLGKFTFFNPDSQVSISNNTSNITKIIETKSGHLYIATHSALYKYSYDSQTFTLITRALITTIYADRKDEIWFGTYYDGLFCYNPKTKNIVSYKNNPSDPKSLSHNRVTAIYEATNGAFWVTTYGGGLNLFNLETKAFTTFTEENTRKKVETTEEQTLIIDQEGLPNNVIYGILEDSAGNLWLSTNKGISRFTPSTKKFKNYNAIDGLQSNEFNTGAYFKSERGEMFFGGVKGFNRFFPEKIKDNPYSPPIMLTGFKVFNKPMIELSKSPVIELSYQDNFFSFEFAALNYIRTEKNLYAYKMEGFNKDWVYCGTRRYASYTNLDPGTYIFRVKGSNNDGVWNEEGISVKIIINPPIWRTWWAYLFYLLVVIGVIAIFIRSRVKKIQFQAELREAKLKTIAAEQQTKATEEIKQKNQKLEQKNTELIELHQRADRIFSALAKTLPGTVLDEKYRLEEQIGQGGFGMVYRATDLAMKKAVAIKIFRPIPGNDSAENLERFQQEAISACRVNHPNAVSVLDSGLSSDGIAYLVMELLTGHTLKVELKKQSKVSLRHSIEILLAVCQVLTKAHTAGILHRDIKPDNIFLHNSEEGEVIKVLDFGIAKLIENNITGQQNLTGTSTSKLVGTPIYMAPERLTRQPYDGRSDIYSVGVIFYEILTGRPPFLQLPIGLFSDISLSLTDIQNLKRIYPNIPEEVDQILIKALAKNPDERLTAKEMTERLESLLNKLSSGLIEDITVENNLPSNSPTLENFIKINPELLDIDKNSTHSNNETWQEIEKLFNYLLEFPFEEREVRLKDICLDVHLQTEVKSLLDSYQAAEIENFSLSLGDRKDLN